MSNKINSKIIRRSLFVWLLIVPLAILNGGLRNHVIEPMIGRYAQPISGIILCILIFCVCLIFIPRLGNGSQITYVILGILWVVITIAFEFLMGFIEGFTLDELLSAYDITTGNLWLIVLFFTGFSPWLSAKMKKII